MEPIDLHGEAGPVLAPAPGRLLVAAPMLTDPNFERTIVLLLDVDEDGVLGVVLNRPSDLLVAEVLDGWSAAVDTPPLLFHGGPVGEESALALGTLAPGHDDLLPGWRPLYAATGLVDLDVPVEALAPALGGLRVYAGYAGWSAGQLDDEIAEGGWFVVEGAPGDAFSDDPDGLWVRVLRRQPPPLSWLATYRTDPSRN